MQDSSLHLSREKTMIYAGSDIRGHVLVLASMCVICTSFYKQEMLDALCQKAFKQEPILRLTIGVV